MRAAIEEWALRESPERRLVPSGEAAYRLLWRRSNVLYYRDARIVSIAARFEPVIATSIEPPLDGGCGSGSQGIGASSAGLGARRAR
jgi:hypothetical protein